MRKALRRLDRFAGAAGAATVSEDAAAASGSGEALAPVPPILERLVESGQAGGVVQAVRGSLGRPNVVIGIHEDLFARSVNRPIDQ